MNKKILILEELKRYAIDTANRIRKLSTEKVDKQDGKGLSSNDFTTSEKEKLKDISVATEDKPGLVKPDGDTITMDMDGTLHGTTIDELFSLTSTNPVQNKVVKAKFDEIEEKVNANETTILSHTEALNTLSGEGEGSVKKTAKDTAIAEITKVIADAPESFDTLKEISDWISNHESDASAMNSAIQTNKTDIASLKTDKVDKETGKSLLADTDKANYDDAVSKAHTHDNKSVLDGITSDKVTAWDNKSDFSGNYNDLSDKPTIPKGDGTTITMDEDGTLHGQSVDIMTVDKAGIGKPDGDTIEVSTDATISVSSKALTFSDHDTATSGTSFTDAEDGNMLVTDWTKNLLNPTLETTTQNGVTCTNNGDGTYTVKGTATADTFFWFSSVKTDKNASYKCLGTPYSLSELARLVFVNTNNDNWRDDWGNGVIIKDCDKIDPSIFVPNGKTVSDIIVKPMITTDLNATYDDFVPYGGYEIQSCGKNLLNPTFETTTQNGVTCTNNGDGTYTLNGTATDGFTFELGCVNLNKFIHKTCLLIDCGKAANSSDKRFGLIAKETTDWVWVRANDSNDYKAILNEYYYTKNVSVRIEGVKGDSYNNAIVKPMLTTDLNATYDDFEPYTGETITVTNDTESPAFGLKSHKGITNIISPANVKCVYPTNESGKGVLDAMYNNSQLRNELSKLKNAILAMGGTV